MKSPVRAWFVLEFLTLRSLDHLIGKLLSLFSVRAVDLFNVTEVSVRVMYSLCQSSIVQPDCKASVRINR